MSHNLNSMAYYGATPWHGLGKKVESAMTAAEAIQEAGLAWQVAKEPIFLQDSTVIPSNYAMVRQDTRAPLGVVGDRYTPLQNNEAFRFFDAVVGLKAAMYHTAGALGAGERIWILAQLPREIHVKNVDTVKNFLLLTNSHNGTSAVQVLFTPIRVVCQNTLNCAIGDGKKGTRLRHTASLHGKASEVQEYLGILNQTQEIFAQAAERLASVQVTSAQFRAYAQGIFAKGTDGASAELTTRLKNKINDVEYLFNYGKGAQIQEVKHTLWTAYNAFTEYADYRNVRDTGKDEASARAESLLFGMGAKMKQDALDAALVLAR